MQKLTSSEDVWNAHVRTLKTGGFISTESNVPYQEIKDFTDRGQYKVPLPKEVHIASEFEIIDALLPFLFQRKWFLLESPDDSCPFITSDMPFILQWKNPATIPSYAPRRPRYVWSQTNLIFPLTKRLLLVGDFEQDYGEFLKATVKEVAALNTTITRNAMREIYAPSLNFRFAHFETGELSPGRELLEMLKHISKK